MGWAGELKAKIPVELNPEGGSKTWRASEEKRSPLQVSD